MEQTIEPGISNLVGALSDPIIVFPSGWGDILPEWIKTQVTLERLIENMKSLKGETPTGTDAEACAYLYTVSLTQPMGADWANIYLYISTQEMRKQNKDNPPAYIAVNELSDDQMKKLKQLKEWIYRQRTKRRQEKDRAERHEVREQAQKEVKAPQFKMF